MRGPRTRPWRSSVPRSPEHERRRRRARLSPVRTAPIPAQHFTATEAEAEAAMEYAEKFQRGMETGPLGPLLAWRDRVLAYGDEHGITPTITMERNLAEGAVHYTWTNHPERKR